jgi:hypothetical protein
MLNADFVIKLLSLISPKVTVSAAIRTFIREQQVLIVQDAIHLNRGWLTISLNCISSAGSPYLVHIEQLIAFSVTSQKTRPDSMFPGLTVLTAISRITLQQQSLIIHRQDFQRIALNVIR